MMKKKIAVFEYIDSCLAGVQTVRDYEGSGSTIRVSEWLEVDFPEREKSEILPEIVEGIDKEIEEIKEKAMNAVSELQTKKAELLALRHGEQ